MSTWEAPASKRASPGAGVPVSIPCEIFGRSRDGFPDPWYTPRAELRIADDTFRERDQRKYLTVTASGPEITHSRTTA